MDVLVPEVILRMYMADMGVDYDRVKQSFYLGCIQ